MPLSDHIQGFFTATPIKILQTEDEGGAMEHDSDPFKRLIDRQSGAEKFRTRGVAAPSCWSRHS